MGFKWFSEQTIIFINIVNQLIFIIDKCDLFEKRTEFLNII